LSIVQINPFRPRTSESATESQFSRISVKIFVRSALAWGPEKNFSPGPETDLRGSGFPQFLQANIITERVLIGHEDF